MPPRKTKSPATPKAKRQTKAASEGIAPEVVAEAVRPRGRPSAYTKEAAYEICERLADGETLRQICRSEHLPDERTVRRWYIDNVEGFSPQYARAREIQLERMADEILEVSDDATNDWMLRNHGDDKEASWVVNGEHVTRSRLRIDSRKWLLSKLKPERYGDKVMHAGHDGGALAVPVINVTTTGSA